MLWLVVFPPFGRVAAPQAAQKLTPKRPACTPSSARWFAKGTLAPFWRMGAFLSPPAPRIDVHTTMLRPGDVVLLRRHVHATDYGRVDAQVWGNVAMAAAKNLYAPQRCLVSGTHHCHTGCSVSVLR